MSNSGLNKVKLICTLFQYPLLERPYYHINENLFLAVCVYIHTHTHTQYMHRAYINEDVYICSGDQNYEYKVFLRFKLVIQINIVPSKARALL